LIDDDDYKVVVMAMAMLEREIIDSPPRWPLLAFI
jgi:hypothetical protein